MELETDFADFVSEIRPTKNQRDDLKTGHQTLRSRLRADSTLKPIIASDFLQGSYKRATAVRPKNDRRADVDVIVVTRLHESEYTPHEAMDLFKPFLDEHYKGKWKFQGRSVGIELSYVELDLVLTSAPLEAEIGIFLSEAVTSDDDLEEAQDWRLNDRWIASASRKRSDARQLIADAARTPEWQAHALRIPDREANTWESTHPLEQIRWARDMNAATGGHFINVVKALKWWRLGHDEPKHPKGFPLERLIGDCCPSTITSVAEGITLTLEGIVVKYATAVRAGKKPVLPDYGVNTHDVFKRVTVDDFKKFYDLVATASALARKAFNSMDRTDSGNLWRELLGPKFPSPPEGGGKKTGFSSPGGAASPGESRFA